MLINIKKAKTQKKLKIYKKLANNLYSLEDKPWTNNDVHITINVSECKNKPIFEH